MNRRGPMATVIGLILLVAACSVRPIPSVGPSQDASLPSTTPEPSSVPSEAAQLPPDLAVDIADVPLVVIAPDNSVLVGTLGRGWTRVDRPANVGLAWGRILGTAPRVGQLEIWEASVDGTVEVLHTSRFGADATADVTATSDGEMLMISNVTIGMRLVDVRTGVEQEVIAADGRPAFNAIEWSPSGARGVASSCDEVTCTAHVFDRDSLTSMPFEGFSPAAIAGATVIGYEEVANPAPILLDVDSGVRAPVGALEELWDAAPLAEDSILAWGSTPDGYGLVVYDLASGEERVVTLDRFTRRPVEPLIGPTFAVLTANDGLPLGGNLDLLDLTTGKLTSGVIPVPSAP